MQGQYSFLQQDPRFLQQQQQQQQQQQHQQGAAQRQSGHILPQQTGYLQPQQTGYAQNQQTGYVQPQQTGFVPPQQTGYMQPQRTGYAQPQMTGFSPGGMMRPQQTGYGLTGAMGSMPPVPSLPGQFQGQQQHSLSPAGSSPMPPTGYMGSNQLGPMAAQPTGYGMGFRGQMPALGASSQPFLNTFMPAPGSQPSMGFGGGSFQPSQMQFAQPGQFNGMNLQQTFQQQNQQQIGQSTVKVPWKLSSEEKKSYDQIFRAWDQAGTGFIEGKMSTEVFAQSALPREDLMQIWALADVENRGKLNLAEFHVAMGLIYRRLNGNPIPATLPPEMVPPSARDLDNSVDFLKDLLKKDNARATGESYGQHTLGPVRSLHGARSSPNLQKDATMYKHDELESSGTYRSRSRHIDRSAIRHSGDTRGSSGVDDMKHELDRTESMLESSRRRDEEDDSLDQELEDVKYQIRRIQDDIEHISRSGRRSEAKDNERRKLERELLRLRHEDLPRIEAKIEDREVGRRREAKKKSQERDLRNNRNRFDSDDRLSDYEDHSGRRDSYPDKGYLRGTYDRDTPSRSSDRINRNTPSRTSDRINRDIPSRSSYRESSTRAYDQDDEGRERYDRDRGEARRDSVGRHETLSPSSPAIKSPPPPPSGSTAPAKTMTAEEKKAYIQAEAQRRIQERLRSLGISGPSTPSTNESGIESRLEQEKQEAALRASKADQEAEEREKQRQLRLEEERLSKVRADEELNAKASLAVKQVKEEVNALTASEKPDDGLLAEEEALLKKREEALAREKAARLARIKQLEEEEEESRRLEEEFQKKKSMFASRPPSSQSAVKKTPPPPPMSRGKAPPPPSSLRSISQVPPPASPTVQAPASNKPVNSPPAVVIESSDPPAPPPPPAPPASSPSPVAASTNPFHRLGSSSGQLASTPSASSISSKLSPNNPFFKPVDPAASTPAARPAPPAQVPFRPPPRPQDSDDEWDAKEKDEDEDSDEEGAATARQARQGLAEALFGSGLPSRPQSAAAGASNSAPSAPVPPPAPPSAPPPPKSSAAASSSGAAPDRGVLLGAIRGGATLRKTQTNDRSASAMAGKVLGSSSPPPQLNVEDNSAIDKRRSVDWIGGMAADGMRSPSFQTSGSHSDLPTHAEESSEKSAEETGPRADNTEDVTSSFDMNQTIRVRSLYAYEPQRSEDLALVENIVIEAHPSKTDDDWLYGTTVKTGASGTFPKAYVTELQVTWGKALYEYIASSSDEVSLTENAMVAVVDNLDPDWFKVEDQGRIGLAPGAYIELSG